MNDAEMLRLMSALAQPTRLQVFRTLCDALPEGLAAGELATAAGAPANTMSAHLAILSRAGLVSARRSGRSIVYSAEAERALELSAAIARTCGRQG